MKIYMTTRYPIRALITGRVLYEIMETLEEYGIAIWKGHEAYNFLNSIEHSEHLTSSGVASNVMPWSRSVLFDKLFPTDT